MPRYLTIDRCPNHGIYAISLDNETGGTRLTPSKCCGQWQRVKAWTMTSKELRRIADELTCAADQVDQEQDA